MGTSAPNGLGSGTFYVRQGSDHMVSFCGDAEDGWFVQVEEDDSPTFTRTVLPLVRDDTDTDGNGWARLHGRWRPMNATTKAYIAICASKDGTYQFSSVKLQPIKGSARKPDDWSRTSVTPLPLTRSHEITLDGSSDYTTSLIKAGDYVIGATARVTGAITFGTATRLALGTASDPEVWARHITDPVALTSSTNFKPGTVSYFVAEDQNVLLTFTQDDGTAGTATSGKVMIVLEYTRSAPTPGP